MDPWQFRDSTWTHGSDFSGYEVEATDGPVGRVDDSTNDITASYVVVDVGSWILGKRRLVPAGAISVVDHDSRTLTVSMTKDQIENAPDYDGDTWGEESRGAHHDYYTPYSQ